MAKYDGWIVKNKHGNLIIWTFGDTKRELIDRVAMWESLQKKGNQIVKVKLVEVE